MFVARKARQYAIWHRSLIQCHCYRPYSSVVPTSNGTTNDTVTSAATTRRSERDTGNASVIGSSSLENQKTVVTTVRLEPPSSHTDRVSRITLCDASRRNPLSTETMKVLIDRLEIAGADVNTGCVILAAEGPVFSAGHDLRELVSAATSAATASSSSSVDTCTTTTEYHHHHHDPHADTTTTTATAAAAAAAADDIFALCARLMTTIRSLPVPVVAEVGGLATAAGCQLVATCDLAVAAEESATFCTPGVNIGLFCHTPAVALSRAVTSPKAAMRMLLSGQPESARDALASGLVSHVVPDDELTVVTSKIACQVAAHDRSVLASGKAGFYQQLEAQGIDAAYTLASERMSHNLVSLPAALEGIGGFYNKK